MNKEELVDLAKCFISEILSYEAYFKEISDKKGWDLIILSGSNVRGFNDRISDLDLFLISSAACQIEHKLSPVNNYIFKGAEFDVSMIATEKIIRDAYNKMNYNWWVDSIIIYYRNKYIKDKFIKAASLKHSEFLEIIWTQFVIYEINTFKIGQSLQRNDLVSAYACWNENIEALISTVLASEGVYCHNKWYGRNLKKLNLELYKKILTFYQADYLQIQEYNKEMKEYFVTILKKAGFQESEISNCEKCNLSKLLFQRF